MKHRLALCLAALVASSMVACFGGEKTDSDDSSAAEVEVPKIPILPGYKYYVGGPVLGADAYGRYRIEKFQGEVEQPPSRGMIFGMKQEGEAMEYRVWANGVLVAFHRGKMRDGLFWQDYVEGYRGGKLVARERDLHFDEDKRTRITTEDIDPETGEVIREKETLASYAPPVYEGQEEDEAAPADGATD